MMRRGFLIPRKALVEIRPGHFRLKKDAGPQGFPAISHRATIGPHAPQGEGYDSRLESDYAWHLYGLFLGKEVVWWKHHPFTIHLPGRRNAYTPDFLVQFADGRLEIHEVKGAWIKNRREGITKFKTAAGLHRWARFVLVERIRKQWFWTYELETLTFPPRRPRAQ